MALCVTAKKVTAKQIGFMVLFFYSLARSLHHLRSQTRGDAKCYKVFVLGAEEHVTIVIPLAFKRGKKETDLLRIDMELHAGWRRQNIPEAGCGFVRGGVLVCVCIFVNKQ